MAYKKLNFKDRIIEKPMTYNIITNEDGTVTLQPVTGEIYQEGTKINSNTMEHIEKGIVDLEQKLNNVDSKINSLNVYNKNDFAVLEGTMTINATSQSFVEINYPTGFNANNCVVISQMTTPQGTTGIFQSGKVSNSNINYSLTDMTINPRVNLKNENIRIYIANANSTQAVLDYKVVLMKIK